MSLSVVAGDTLAFSVEFQDENGAPVLLQNGVRAEMVLHTQNGDIVILPSTYEDNTASFLLSGDDTAELLQKNPYGHLRFCIRLVLADGSRQTLLYRQRLTVERC